MKMEEDKIVAGIKLAVIAKEAVGKTTVISGLEKALVVSTDNKAFSGKVAHFRVSEYNGLPLLIETIVKKVGAYQEKYKELPKTIVIDSVTHLANNMERWASDKFTGFAIYSNLGKDILAFNHFLETQILPAGMNVVLTSHCQLNTDTGRYEIAAPGAFGKNGSWLSVVDNSIFIEIKGTKRVVHTNSMKFPARSNIDMPESIPMEEYNINDHIALIEAAKMESEQYSI